MNITTTGENRVFTTFEVGKICGVFHTTVINWAKAGRLRAHQTPGGHRRIRLPDLLEFMRKFDMPIPPNLTDRRKRVLIVEDDPAVQRMLRRTLRDFPDLDVQACAGGIEALIAIGHEAPDLLVLDIRVPQVNGLEVCKILRANPQTRPIRIIGVTGEALGAEDERFLRENTEAFFRKPLSTVDFRAKAAALLELSGSAAVG